MSTGVFTALTPQNRPLDFQKTLFWRRGAHAFGSSRGAHVGKEGCNACRRDDRSQARHQSDLGDNFQRSYAFYDQRIRRRECGCVHRISEATSDRSEAQDLLDRRSRARHRAKKTKAFVETLGRQLMLFFLPPYSPDRNPDELVWKHLKADTVGRMATTSKVDFKEKVVASMRSLQKRPDKISAFYQKPSLRYAA